VISHFLAAEILYNGSVMSKNNEGQERNELQDIREILGTIVANMVTKEELQVFKDEFREFKEEMHDFQQETRQNFRDVRDDIAALRQETDFEFDDLLGRMKYVEQKLGIQSGK
jgi:hypothetical protein